MASSPLDLTKSSAAGALVYELAQPLFKEGGKKIEQAVKDVGGGIFNAARDAAYDKLTDVERREAKPRKDGEPDLTYGGLRGQPKKGAQGTQWSTDIKDKLASGALGAARGQREPSGAHSGIDYRKGAGDKADEFLAHFTKTNAPKFFGSEMLFNNPEAVSNLAGIAGIAAPVAAVGFGLSALGKPETEYSVPVQPSGGYSNQSVESAMASAGAKYELEDQKFQHKMALAQMREQSRVPGVQDTSMGAYGGSGMSSGAITGLMQNQFGNTRQYF